MCDGFLKTSSNVFLVTTILFLETHGFLKTATNVLLLHKARRSVIHITLEANTKAYTLTDNIITMLSEHHRR